MLSVSLGPCCLLPLPLYLFMLYSRPPVWDAFPFLSKQSFSKCGQKNPKLSIQIISKKCQFHSRIFILTSSYKRSFLGMSSPVPFWHCVAADRQLFMPICTGWALRRTYHLTTYIRCLVIAACVVF